MNEDHSHWLETATDPKIIEQITDAMCLDTFWEDPLDRSDELHTMRKLVEDNLDEYDRELYYRYYIKGDTQESLADHYNITQSTIFFHLSKIEERIRMIVNLPNVNWIEELEDLDLNEEDSSLFIQYINLKSKNKLQAKTKFGRSKVDRVISNIRNKLDIADRSDALEYMRMITKKGGCVLAKRTNQ